MDVNSLHAPFLSGLNIPWRILLPTATKIMSPAHGSVENMAPCVDFFYLARGRVFVTQSDVTGRERVMFCLGPDTLFNEAPAVAGFDALNSPFICDQKCIYYRFSHTLLHDPGFISNHPDLISNLMTGLGIKVLIHHTSLSNFNNNVPAITRLSRFLASIEFISKSNLRTSLNMQVGS